MQTEATAEYTDRDQIEREEWEAAFAEMADDEMALMMEVEGSY